MKPEFEIGILGGGVAVDMALPAFSLFNSVAISYEDSSYRNKFSKFKFFEDPNDLFDSTKVASLYIATPVNVHKGLLLKASKSKLPVLVEKPLCLDLTECDEIASCDTHLISVAFKKRFSPMARQIRRVRSENKGSVSEIEYIWLAPHPGANHWKLNREIAGGGVIMDIGSHILDFFEHCIGKIKSHKIHQVSFDKKFMTESLVEFSCRFEDGSNGRVLIGWAEKESIQKLEFREKDESVTWIKYGDASVSQLTCIKRQSCQTVNCDRSADYFPMFREFQAFSKGQRNFMPGFNDGIRNIFLMSELYNIISSLQTK